ncbi:MAG: NAD+ synthase [Candidatus Omnitrophica bacterium CG23_combo_of_CG06-09_8_20_14_all_40_11]|nr:MAG: NAD+ synthase [Candidatus Omnitrophica bacterium CG23_combo_of_CG06-09_8_20_14_all_40_11]
MRKENLRIALAQINCTVGDLEGNRRKINGFLQIAQEQAVDIVSFPELAVTGYPPEDLLLKPKFIEDNLEKLKELTQLFGDIIAVVGFVDRKGEDVYNAAAVIYNGKIRGIYRKMFLPNYGVFDEKRYFRAGGEPLVFRFAKSIFGVNICEDIWHINGPTKMQSLYGAKLILNINASPYYSGRIKERERVIQSQAKDNHVFIAYTNLVGGQDELVFDGQSMIVDTSGNIISRAEAFKEDLLIADLDIPASLIKKTKRVVTVADTVSLKKKNMLSLKSNKPIEPAAEIYQALILGLKDYVTKNSFQKVVIGLSGGIDSSLVATLASDALGKDNCFGVFMPSRYSSPESETDARQLAQNLSIEFITISIEQIYKMYLLILESHFIGQEKDITEENLQARIRDNILMALSNKFGWLVLTTGNKSEMSTGYATLYGDMAGGFAVIKDVPKQLVYKLAKYRNSVRSVIPERVLTKEPTAELKPNQKDCDTLPVYATLDPILKAYIEEDKDLKEITHLGFDHETVKKVLAMVDKSEYKRRQSPPGIKITPRAFGKDRRMPITNKYRG